MQKRFITKELAEELLKEYGSPLYVYSEETLRKMSRKMSTFLEGSGLKYRCHYAVKANGNPHLLKIMKEEGLFVDSMSLGELAIVEMAGFTEDEILYVCNNVSKEEMKIVNDKKILMVFDSISQVETFGQMCPNTDIIVRINPGVLGVGHSKHVITSGEDTKFGISEDLFTELKETAKKYNLRIIGLHQHLGSLFLDDKIDEYLAGVKKLLELAHNFTDLKIIDLGGGFGISYYPDKKELDFDLLNSKLIPILKDFNEVYGEVEFVFEPGRIVIAEAGVILGTVTSVKKNMGLNYVGTDIGMGLLVRPSMYGSYHYIEVLNDQKEEILATVAGNVCESCDVLGKDRMINTPLVGDKIIIYDAGAYGFSMSSNYTGRTRPAEVLLTETSKKLIRRKEEIKDLVSRF